MKLTMQGLMLGALSLAVAGCDGERRGTFRGSYVHGFEASSFTQCGATESWSAYFEASHPTLDSAVAAEERIEDFTRVYLSVHGRLSPEGSYGHLGGSRRALTVERIFEVRPWDPEHCR